MLGGPHGPRILKTQGKAMDVALAIITCVISATAWGILFLYLAKRPPKIIISRHISKSPENGEYIYRWKFYNRSKAFLKTIHYKMSFIKNIGEHNEYVREIEFTQKPHIVDPYQKSSGSFSPTDYAVQVRIPENLDKEMADKMIRLEFSARDHRNNKFTAKTILYTKHDIREGRFEIGDSIEIVKE